jgi:hypothetical protein
MAELGSSPYINHFIQPDTIIPNPADPQSWNRFSYVGNNPIRYTDPTGHMRCDFCDGEGGNLTSLQKSIDAQKLAELEYDRTGRKQKRNREVAETILYDGTEILASILFEPADWAYTASHCANGECSPWMLLGMAPLIPSSAGKYGEELIALVGRKGFDNFRQLKKYLGSAGDNMDWHHIVEQSQIIRSGYSPRTIHNTGNVIAIDADLNRNIINGFYGSIRPFTDGMVVRDWIAGQSFEAQYEFGLKVLRDYGAIP